MKKLIKQKLCGEVSLLKLTEEEKSGRIDIKATINKSKIIDIEMQLRDNKNMDKRSEFYGGKLIAEQMAKNENYITLKPVILINILNYNMLELPEYCTKTVTVADKHRDYEIIKDITYYFIELPKFRKERPRLANKLEYWLALIDGEGELIEMAKERDDIIKEAVEELEELLANKEVRELYEYRLSAQLEENARIAYAKEEGLKKRNRRAEQKNGMEKRNGKTEWKNGKRERYKTCC